MFLQRKHFLMKINASYKKHHFGTKKHKRRALFCKSFKKSISFGFKTKEGKYKLRIQGFKMYHWYFTKLQETNKIE